MRLFASLLSCLLLSQLGAAELRLASDPWAPFTDVASKPRFALDLVHAALDRAEIPASTTIVATGSLTTEVESGQVDGSAAYWRNAEREGYLLYSQPYLENRLVLVGKTGSDVSAAGLSALAGKRVALVATYAYGDAITTAKGQGVVFVTGPDQQTNLDRLRNGEVDYLLMDELVVMHLQKMQADDMDKHLAVGKWPMVKRDLYLALRKDLPEAEAILKKFNDAIVTMRADGSFNKILGIDWVRTDFDADGELDWVHAGGAWSNLPPTAKDGYRLPTTVPTPQGVKGPGGRIKMGGEVYDSWKDVPRFEGERAPGAEDVDERDFLRLNFREF